MKVNVENLRRSHQISLFVVDAFMLTLITLNLIWIVFDSLFASEVVRGTLNWISPEFTQFYGAKIHPDFVSYDLIFVSIFIAELLLRWLVAILQRTHQAWYYYPFVHWYDVLGCIPVGSFRWLRLLRVISILYRLQKYGIIDLKNSGLGRFLLKYYDILVEEISDRVVVNVLNGVQGEVQQGSPVIDKMLTEVLIPQKSLIANWLTVKINEICDEVYIPNQAALRQYIERSLADSLAKDSKVAALESIPVVGGRIVDVIDQTVSDLVFDIIDGMIMDVGKQETDHIVRELLDGILHRLLQPSEELNRASRLLLIDTIEIIKAEVQVQRWRGEPNQ